MPVTVPDHFHIWARLTPGQYSIGFGSTKEGAIIVTQNVAALKPGFTTLQTAKTLAVGIKANGRDFAVPELDERFGIPVTYHLNAVAGLLTSNFSTEALRARENDPFWVPIGEAGLEDDCRAIFEQAFAEFNTALDARAEGETPSSDTSLAF